MAIQTIEQKRAKHALGKIQDIIKSEYKKEYLSYVKALPANILQNGFGQAMAMELAASHQAHKNLYKHLQSWLCEEQDNPNRPYKNTKNTDLISEITKNNQTLYIQAQAEAMAYLAWLKKSAVAYLTDE